MKSIFEPRNQILEHHFTQIATTTRHSAKTLAFKDEARARSTTCLCCATLAFRFDYSRPGSAKYVCEVAGVSSLTFSFALRC